MRTVPIKNDDGTVTKLINITRDVRPDPEGRGRTAAQLGTEMAQVLTSIPSVLICTFLTADNKIMRWNGAAEKTFGIEGRKMF